MHGFVGEIVPLVRTEGCLPSCGRFRRGSRPWEIVDPLLGEVLFPGGHSSSALLHCALLAQNPKGRTWRNE